VPTPDRELPYRPRTSYERKRQVMQIAEGLNGTEEGVGSFHRALGIVLRYLEVLSGDVECPECGAPPAGSLSKNPGKWQCSECHVVGGELRGHFDVWDYLGTKNPEEATVPGLGRGVRMKLPTEMESERPDTTDKGATSHRQKPHNSGMNW